MGSATTMDYVYIAPDYLCITDPVLCESPSPPGNAHRLTFTLVMAAEANQTNDITTVTVNVLPRSVVGEDVVAGEFPLAAVVAGAGIAGVAGIVVWYRFLRAPQVDEELYASIYGGGVEGATPQAPASQDGIDDYFKSQQKPEQVPEQYQGMADSKVEEARKLYGDQYGKRRR